MTTTARTVRRVRPVVGVLMAAEAVSLGVMSFLHLHGDLGGRAGSGPFRPGAAGIAEAVIGVVLIVAAVVVLRTPERARPVAIGAIGFAIVGFAVGISITISGGDAIDIAYHATVLPILLGTMALAVFGGRAI